MYDVFTCPKCGHYSFSGRAEDVISNDVVYTYLIEAACSVCGLTEENFVISSHDSYERQMESLE